MSLLNDTKIDFFNDYFSCEEFLFSVAFVKVMTFVWVSILFFIFNDNNILKRCERLSSLQDIPIIKLLRDPQVKQLQKLSYKIFIEFPHCLPGMQIYMEQKCC